MLALVTPAADRNLLAIEDLRSAAGLDADDSSQDPALSKLGLRVSDLIAQECSVAPAGIAPPTLKQETVAQTFRLSCAVSMLLLARRFVASVTSVAVNGEAVDASAFELDAGAGLLRRVCNGRFGLWQPATIVVTYVAGFQAVPNDLALAAATAVQEQWSAVNRDPLLKRDRVEGVGEQEFWVGGIGAKESAFSSTVQAMLDPYRTVWVS